jgi:hypothetical protein
VDGPEILLSSSGGTGDGQTLTVNANILNTGGPVSVDVRAWIGIPTGQVLSLFNFAAITIPHASPTAPSGSSSFFNGPIFTRTFNGSEPPGQYVVGLTFQDTVTGQTVATQTSAFRR